MILAETGGYNTDMGKERWEVKRKKKKVRASLKARRHAVEVERLRIQVTILARAACEESRVGRCINRYTQFAIEPDGSLSCGFKPIRSINRNECRQYLEAAFEPVEKKGLLELLVDGVERADRSMSNDGEPLELSRNTTAR